jgi:flagellar hook-associated protein 1
LSGSFFGIEIGMRGLRAHQQALDVTSHNVANASSTGYTRQVAKMQSTSVPVMTGTTGGNGSGVEVYEVTRIRDAFIDEQVRNETSQSGRYNTLQQGLDEVQTFFNEPSDSSLRTVMGAFWSSLQDVANNPESDALRRTAVQSAESMTEAFRHISQQLEDLKTSTTNNLKSQAQRINELGSQIAKINQQVLEVAAQPGVSANDLKDKRDSLLEELSGIVKISVTEDDRSQVRVTIRGASLVSGTDTFNVAFSDDSSGDPHLTITGTDVLPVEPSQVGGAIGGLLELRGKISDEYLADLDTLANDVISEANAVHRTGWGSGDTTQVARDLFTGTGAKSINVSSVITADPSKLAVSADGSSGDGSKALELANLKSKLTMSGDTATFDDYLRGAIGQLGVDSQEAQRYVNNEALLLKELESRRQDVQGVSLDEEMANLVKYQQAYAACARIVTAYDDLLDTLISGTGTTGR